jgi:hypothetical protein
MADKITPEQFKEQVVPYVRRIKKQVHMDAYNLGYQDAELGKPHRYQEEL